MNAQDSAHATSAAGSGGVCEITPVDLGNTNDCGAATPRVCNPKALVKWTKVLAEAQRNTEAKKSRPDAPG
jgi:hypothetical protein